MYLDTIRYIFLLSKIKCDHIFYNLIIQYLLFIKYKQAYRRHRQVKAETLDKLRVVYSSNMKYKKE